MPITIHIGNTIGARQVSAVSNFDFLAPSDLSLSLEGNNVKVEWTSNSNNAKGHKIERSVNGIDFIEIGESKTSSYIDEDTAELTEAYYRVRAFSDLSRYSEYCTLKSIIVSI